MDSENDGVLKSRDKDILSTGLADNLETVWGHWYTACVKEAGLSQ